MILPENSTSTPAEVVQLVSSRSGSALAFKGTSEQEYFAADVVSTLVTDYSILVAALTDSKTSAIGLEMAFGRVFGTRGTLCRLCPSRQIWTLRAPIVREWRWAECRLREFFADASDAERIPYAASRVEMRNDLSAERLLSAATNGHSDAEIATHLGYLKAIDNLALHLGQRDIFIRSRSISLPLPNPVESKLRMRLISMLLGLHRNRYESSLPAIRSYRNTFAIDNPSVYPWWFVDEHLTERQLNWTYRRLSTAEFDWRFE